MATGTGLDAQLMFAAETTVGTGVTPTKTVEFNNESLQWQPTWVEPTGLHVGVKYKRAARLVQSRRSVSGSFEMEHATRNMGLLWKMALGSTVTTPTLISGAAYSQVHQPGDFKGKSLTVQVGRPEPGSGTVRAHTFSGVKVTGWEFSVADNQTATMHFDVDGWDETTATALATPSYVAGAGVFSFNMASVFKLGGTASTTTGTVSIASGVQVPATTIVKKFSLKGAAPMATDRYGLGNSGVKAEQLENDTPTITGSLDAEFDKTTFYDVFKANTTTAMQVDLIGNAIVGGGGNDTLSFVIAALKFKDASPSVTGPDIVQATVDFEVYSDETNAPFQVKLISADSVL